MTSPVVDAYCTMPMGDGYCSTPVPVVPARPTAAHVASPMTLNDLDMTGIAVVIAVLLLTVRWRIRHT